MKKEIISEIKQMQKLMLYNQSKTDSENTQIFEQIIGTPPSDAGGTDGTGGGNGSHPRPRTMYPIPSELKDTTGVKAFQDWVVSQGKGSELGRFGADGKFGRYTSAAWSKYKNDYLNPVNPALIPGNDITNVEPSSVVNGTGTNPVDIVEPSSTGPGGTPIAPQNATVDITTEL